MIPYYVQDFEKLIEQTFDGVILWVMWHPKGAHLSSKNRDVLSLDRIEVPIKARGKGVGTAVLKGLISLADEYKFDITLTPSEEFGSDLKSLRKWYRHHGFRVNPLSWAESRYTPK